MCCRFSIVSRDVGRNIETDVRVRRRQSMEGDWRVRRENWQYANLGVNFCKIVDRVACSLGKCEQRDAKRERTRFGCEDEFC